MNDQTREFLQERFREHYAERPITPPPGLLRREWGFIFYDEGYPAITMRRHKSFNSERELNDYLRSMAPAHVYHSAAYYAYPQAPTMLEKKWQGADLIFDLDADHLPHKEKPLSYSEMLEYVKKEIIRLIDEFLIDDLGFSERDMSIVFSGGRGYHVHVRDERVKPLKSPERREIVDYIMGTGLDPKDVFDFKTDEIVEGKLGKKTTAIYKIRYYTDTGGYGWSYRTAVYIRNWLINVGRLADKDAKIEFKRYGLEGKNASNALEVARNQEQLNKIINTGHIQLSGKLEHFFREMLAGTIKQFRIDLAGKTDEPVTADVKRLIRLPGSIHGGSSFRVVPLTRAQLETFNPLEDAIIFSDSPVRVLVTKPEKNVEIKGKVYNVSEGVGRLPECVAIHLMCRRSAEYEP